ncbi:MAG: hypothetical protein RLZZ373_619, partial [Pseudomonadota bacterium]
QDFDWNRTTCLPREQLGGVLAQEPLWVDLRWARSSAVLDLHHARFRQAVLDLAAPLHGRDKDELDGEDVRTFVRARRLRRAAIAGLAGLTVIAFAAGYVATRQRDRAEQQTTLVRLGRLTVQADLLRARGEPADASVMLAAESLSRLATLGESRLDADLALRGALASLPVTQHEFDFGDSRYRLVPGGQVLIKRDPTVDALSAFTVPRGALASCDASRMGQPVGTPALIVALSASGRWCVLARSNEVFELWQAQPLARVAAWHEAVSPKERLVWRVADDGDTMAMTRRLRATQAPSTASLRVWRRSAPGVSLSLRGAAFIDFAPDGRTFATTQGVWSLAAAPDATARPLWTWPHPPQDIAFSSEGAYVAMRGETAGPVEIWSIAKADVRHRLDRVPPGELVSLGEQASGLAVIGRRETWLWDTLTDRVRVRLPQPAVAAAIDGRDLVALVELDQGNGLTRQRLLRLPFQGAAWAAVPLPAELDAQAVALTIRGTTVRLTVQGEPRFDGLTWTAGESGWTRPAVSSVVARTGTVGSNMAGASAQASASGAGIEAATRSLGRALSTKEPAATIGGPPRVGLGVGADGERVVVTRGEGELVQFDVPTQARLAEISDDGRTAVVLDMGDVVSLHHVLPNDLIAQACRRGPRPMPEKFWTLVPGALTLDVCGRVLTRPTPAR